MAVRSKEEVLEWIKRRSGEDYDDETIGFIEDISDTWDDWEKRQRSEDVDEWKRKYEETDREWRRRYVERFMGRDEKGEDFYQQEDISSVGGAYQPYAADKVGEDKEYKSYEDLFEEVKEG